MNSSQRITLFILLSSLLTQFPWNLQCDISERFEAYGDKGNILRQKPERNFLRNYFVICDFVSQSYMMLFMEQFGCTVFGESDKGYFGSR